LQQKLDKWYTHKKDFEFVLSDWASIRGQLQEETRPPERLMQILYAVDAPLKWSQLNPPVDEERAKFAFMNAALIRKRLTLADLLIFLDWDRDSLWAQIRQSCL